ncbi:MAG: SAP domain-containing protein [Cytophagaceae bacterium]|jgi:hypothetical protein|nr:SAP domain-containing protein [Cytophagaceae bacterium]
MNRPVLDKNITLDDFNNFYWLKEELIEFCRKNGIPTWGGKIEIAERIREFLTTGKISRNKIKKSKSTSTFDWDNETLSRETIISDNYKNGENVRRFFLTEIGSHFSFNIVFMKWLKENKGKTLNDAIVEWNRIHTLKKDKNYESEIAPQFEYNRYMRAFLKDNPTMSSKDAMKFWKLKSALRGSNEYERTDLLLTAK